MAAPTRTPRSKWIDAGLRALAAGGPDAVKQICTGTECPFRERRRSVGSDPSRPGPLLRFVLLSRISGLTRDGSRDPPCN